MATSRKLKAWVRYDGQDNIVPGSLILQANKPKVGKWVEIPAKLCCKPCDCRKIDSVNDVTGWSLTDCEGNTFSCPPGVACRLPMCIDITKPYHGVTYNSTISCDCQCITPASCYCYTLVNPSLTDTYEYGLVTCDGTEIGGSLTPGKGTTFCAQEGSIIKANGILLSQGGSCVDAICVEPSICVSYDISNSSLTPVGVTYLPCGLSEYETIEITTGQEIRICATLGTVTTSVGAIVVVAGLGCLA